MLGPAVGGLRGNRETTGLETNNILPVALCAELVILPHLYLYPSTHQAQGVCT